jgi:hypothetical protein
MIRNSLDAKLAAVRLVCGKAAPNFAGRASSPPKPDSLEMNEAADWGGLERR